MGLGSSSPAASDPLVFPLVLAKCLVGTVVLARERHPLDGGSPFTEAPLGTLGIVTRHAPNRAWDPAAGSLLVLSWGPYGDGLYDREAWRRWVRLASP